MRYRLILSRYYHNSKSKPKDNNVGDAVENLEPQHTVGGNAR
jgi:hypothetical protein